MNPATKKIAAIFVSLVLSAIFIAGCKKIEPDKPEKVYLPQVTTTQIKPGLEQEFTVTGEVFAHQISRITSAMRGEVNSIFVNVGDSVSKGKNLMSLGSSEVSSTFNTASSTLRNAQVGLESTKLSTEKNIQAAEIALDTAKVNLQNTLRQNETLRKQAEESLKATQISSNLGVSSAQTGLDNTIKNSLPTIQSAVTASDKILGISAAYKFTNDSFESNLGALSSFSVSEAERALSNLLDQVSAYTESFENILELLILTEDTLQKTLTVLDNSVTGENYTETSLTTDKTSITTQMTSIRTTISTLESAKDALDTAMQEGNGNSQAILNAQAAYDATIAQLNANKKSAQQAIESAKNALENAKQSAELSKISAKSSVDSAYGVYDQARISKDKLIINAPFNGKISEIHVKTGEEINPGTLLITVEDDTKLNLVAYLSSRDVQKVNVGDVVMIGKDKLSLISSIAPSADPLTKKYKVEISYEESHLRPGELIKLTFITGNGPESDRIFIPLPSLHILPDEIFVWKVENEKTVKAPIEIGEIEGDFIEILRGLEVGDEIVVKGGRLIEDEGNNVEIVN